MKWKTIFKALGAAALGGAATGATEALTVGTTNPKAIGITAAVGAIAAVAAYLKQSPLEGPRAPSGKAPRGK